MSDQLEWKQRYADHVEAAQTHLDNRQAAIHTGMPGTIVSFNPTTMTAVVKPALQAFQTKNGKRQSIDISHIPDVPVHFPGGGGHVMTFPVKQGDECWISFSERSIDHWHQHGGIQEPSDWRMHDLNDAVAHVGLRSQPQLPSGGAHPTSVQIRSDDGNTVIDLHGDSGAVTIRCRSLTITAQDHITLTAPKVDINS